MYPELERGRGLLMDWLGILLNGERRRGRRMEYRVSKQLVRMVL